MWGWTLDNSRFFQPFAQDKNSNPAEIPDLNNPALLENKEHLASVFAHLREWTLELFNSEHLENYDNRWNLARLRVALEIFTDPKVRDFWLYVIMEDQIGNYGIKNIEPLLRIFRENCSDSEALARIEQLYRADLTLRQGHTIRVYKQVEGFDLDAHIFYPPDWQPKDRRPAIVFFHGGSWYQGKPDWMFSSCQKYACFGLVAIAPEYRLYDRHGTSPLECISDGKSLVRWIRENSADLGIDPQKIAAYGFSSGGHLVACSALLDILDEPQEDSSVSSAPNLMIFSSSCFDPTLDNWFVRQVRERFNPESCSPNHNVRPGMPPSLVIHGSDDKMCPFWTAESFTEQMQKAGNQCKLVPLEGAEHFYFLNDNYRAQANQTVEKFLISAGYLISKKR